MCACARARGVLCAWHALVGAAQGDTLAALEAMWRLPARAPEDRQP